MQEEASTFQIGNELLHFRYPSLQDFYCRAASAVASVAEDFKKMEDAFKAVCALFGENYRDTEPDDLFKMIADFIVAFKV